MVGVSVIGALGVETATSVAVRTGLAGEASVAVMAGVTVVVGVFGAVDWQPTSKKNIRMDARNLCAETERCFLPIALFLLAILFARYLGFFAFTLFFLFRFAFQLAEAFRFCLEGIGGR